MKKAAISVVMLACLSGCVALTPQRQVSLTNTFNPQEVAWFNSTGTGSITGQAFFQTRGGQPRTCAGLEVALQPHSTYGDERLRAIYGSTDTGYAPALATRVQFNPDSSAYLQTLKKSTCDAQGNFSFTGLPAGNYVIVSVLAWTIPGQEFAPPQGGALMKSVTLKDGENTRIILTH
ncbi:hypothetical protein ACFCQI_12630 [Rhodanobacter sp. FW102-FHT14D06]|uniref:Carboxypeptidase regulatory-like domain-containing protein n=2 Tax=unclassified Rhodanobacter TaxID=2621553 RepID=A0AB74UKH0_9GAMM